MVDEFTYTHALECIFLPRGYRMLPVAMDGDGMQPDSLREVGGWGKPARGGCASVRESDSQ